MAVQDSEPVMLATNDSQLHHQHQSQGSIEQLDDLKAEHQELETVYQGGQVPRPILTTASEQDPDVAPDIQIRAISELSDREYLEFSAGNANMFTL